MSFVRQIFRCPPRVLSLAMATVAMLGLADPVAAGQPFQTHFAYTNTSTDGDTCADYALVITSVERVRGVYIEWDAPDGSFQRATASVDIEFDNTASNGVTLIEKDHVVSQFTTDGHREIGLWEHVRGAHGIVVIDAGQLVFDNDGNVLFEPGQHDFFHGLSSFCPGFLE